MANVAGIVTDAAGNPVARMVRLYRRDTGVMLAETLSSLSTGAYAFTTAFTGECQVVLLDDAAGALENDQIVRVIPA